jgi:uncharacterized membrane protein YccF (DUF307 family)
MNDDSPSLIVRAVYFVLVGWWVTGIWLGVAWFLNLSIIGLPLGIKMVNKTPKVLTLKEGSQDIDVVGGSSQPSIVVRGIYFVFVGWWLSFLWMTAAYVVSLTVVGLPVGIKMYNYLPKVTSLYDY